MKLNDGNEGSLGRDTTWNTPRHGPLLLMLSLSARLVLGTG